MEEEKDLKPIKVDDFVISDEDMEEFNKNMKEIIVPAVKKTLLTYFKPENYTAPCLKRKSFAFTVYWAFMRDCLIDPKDNGKIVVAWRFKNLENAPKLAKIETKDTDYVFYIDYGKKIGQQFKVPKEDFKKFKRTYVDEIKQLQKKFGC